MSGRSSIPLLLVCMLGRFVFAASACEIRQEQVSNPSESCREGRSDV